MLRAFIAIQIPEPIRKEIVDKTAELRRICDRSVRWVAAGNMHLTIKFLGEIASTRIDLLNQAIETETRPQAPFKLTIGTLGAFPNLRRPRVIWIGVDAAPALKKLEHNVGAAIDRLGYPGDDKPFSAHLTLGRVREQISPVQAHVLSQALAGLSIGQLGTFTVETVKLFRSDLQPAGPIYTCIFTAALGGQPLHEVNSETA